MAHDVYTGSKVYQGGYIPEVERAHRQHKETRDVKYTLVLRSLPEVGPNTGVYCSTYKEK